MAQVAGALSIASAGLSVAQGVRAANIAREQARDQERRGRDAVKASREEARRLVASQRLAMAGSGRTLEGGTVNALLADTMAQEAAREREILSGSNAQAQTLRNEGLSSLLNGVGTGISGLAKWSEGRYQATLKPQSSATQGSR